MANPITRILKLRSNGREDDVVIDIQWPELRANSWFADWRIRFPERERKGSAGGTDAIQAVDGALKLIGAELYASDEHKAGSLTWGDDWSGYGFPVPSNMRDMMTGDDAKYF